jgi:DNA repair protein RadC
MKPIKHQVTEITVAYKNKKQNTQCPAITSSADAAIYIIDGFDQNTIGMKEQFVVLYLNSANYIIGLYRASSGGLSGTVADIRIILSIGLKVLASSMIIAHNHPSGTLKPSSNDIELTSKIKQAAKLMDIKLLDHLIIVPNNQFFSFGDEGLI